MIQLPLRSLASSPPVSGLDLGWRWLGFGHLSFFVWLALELGMVLAGGLTRQTALLPRFPDKPVGGDFEVELAFPDLGAIPEVITLASPPGYSNVVFCLGKSGSIVAITNLIQPTVTHLLNLSAHLETEAEAGLLGIAFHPDFKRNGYFYLTYSYREGGGETVRRYNRLSRFTVDLQHPFRVDPASEQPLLTQLDQDPTHNGGDLEFGPDGYLYVSLGDEGGANNRFENAWYLDKDFFSGILRIDVDRRPGNLEPNVHPAVHPGTYKVPADNPFVGTTSYRVGEALVWPELDPAKIRTEFFAVGFRNPWRMSFDLERNRLFANDVGQARREEVNLVVRGGNHGWHLREGTINWPFEVPQSGMIDPLFEYEHDEGRLAITGALYYRGTQYADLHDSYLFADYRGHIGVLKEDATGWQARWIAQANSVSDLALHPLTGELLIMNVFDGYIYKLVRRLDPGDPLPETLTQTGAFTDLSSLTPAVGVIPYELNVPFWSDGALKRRWFGIRNDHQRFEFRNDSPWTVPSGAFWVKHFDIERIRGDRRSLRRLETRFLMGVSNGVYGVSYRWNPEGTEAFLVPPEGADEAMELSEGGVTRWQRWRYPSRTECLTCHTANAGWALGFNTAQLHRTVHAGSVEQWQLRALSEAGYVDAVPKNLNSLPQLTPLSDTRWSLEHRVRSYLDANCAQCHRPGASHSARWDARFSTPFEVAGLLDAMPVNRLESDTARILLPGALSDSVIYRRISEMAGYHMPPLGTFLRDDVAVEALAQWISGPLVTRSSYANWLNQHLLPIGADEASRKGDPDQDGASNEAEYLFDTNPRDSASTGTLEVVRGPRALSVRYFRKANRVYDLQWTDDPKVAGSWSSLDDPANAYFVSAEDGWVELTIPSDSEAMFYRLMVTER